MKLVMGPVLGFRGSVEGIWKVCALTVTDGADPGIEWKVGSQDGKAKKTLLKNYNGLTVCVHDWEIQQTPKPQRVTYSLNAQAWTFVVPPLSHEGLRLAYASCNGFSSPAVMKKVADKNERWKHLLSQHKKSPFHLLLMGGDQVYADSLWEICPQFNEWVHKLERFRIKSPFSADMKAAAEKFYFELYCSRWAQEEVQRVLASIPTLMMWDDHDIFDGWGSYDKKMQECPVYEGLFAQARQHFRTFQLKTAADPCGWVGGPNFSFAFKVGHVAIVVPDLRSERTMDRIMSDASWAKIYAWLDTNLQGCSHLFFIASIPVVYPSFNFMETLLGIIPGRQEIEDDLRDHWTSKPHRAERTRLIHRLLSYSGRNKCRVTILSGDVHVGAVGQIDSPLYTENMSTNTVHQLISSGIVHPSPPGLALCFLKNAGDSIEKVDTAVTAQMGEFPGTSTRFISARNWLGLTIDAEQERLWAEWFAEGESTPYTKVIPRHTNGHA